MLTDNEKEIIYNCLKVIADEGSGECGAVTAYNSIASSYEGRVELPTYNEMSDFILDDINDTYNEYYGNLE
jgi:hypothetical protein